MHALQWFGRSFLVIAIVASAAVIFSDTQDKQTPKPNMVSRSSMLAAISQPKPTEPMPTPIAPVPSPSPEPVPVTPDFSLPVTAEGFAPELYRIPTSKKVVFLTIDDGAIRLPLIRSILAEHNVKATLFLNSIYTTPDPDYFKQLVTDGAVIENHTVDHADLTQLTYDQQYAQICGNADMMAAQFGTRPTLFRPPYGSYNQTTLKAAADCGQKAVVTWHAKANGGSMQYQDDNMGLLPGDIVLIHFRPEFKEDFAAFWEATQAAGLQTELLENWL